jgi:Protein of unknown function (DUF3616)
MSIAVPIAKATLEFDPARLMITEEADLRRGLSAVVHRGEELWLACDEGCRLERLSRTAGPDLHFGVHATFGLHDLLAMPALPSEEADVEGLDVDGGFLWLVGSHSSKRKKPDANDTPAKVAEKLAKPPKRDGNRHVLARIPLDGREPKKIIGEARAGSIATTPTSSALLDAIVQSNDPHLSPFITIPGKDNGFDIEGLAVRGSRVIVGLRGPVLREWACLLQLEIEAGPAGALQLKPLDGAAVYRKHFVKLAGLGLRDLAWLDDDLLMLAGPTMAHDGPIEIWRWKGAAQAAAAQAADVRRVLTLPIGEEADRAEGLTSFEPGPPASVLVVFDSPSDARLVAPSSVRADVFRLP